MTRITHTIRFAIPIVLMLLSAALWGQQVPPQPQTAPTPAMKLACAERLGDAPLPPIPPPATLPSADKAGAQMGINFPAVRDWQYKRAQQKYDREKARYDLKMAACLAPVPANPAPAVTPAAAAPASPKP